MEFNLGLVTEIAWALPDSFPQERLKPARVAGANVINRGISHCVNATASNWRGRLYGAGAAGAVSGGGNRGGEIPEVGGRVAARRINVLGYGRGCRVLISR